MLPENNISFARKQSLNNKHTLYKNSNINLFTSFTLGNKIIARGYDSRLHEQLYGCVDCLC